MWIHITIITHIIFKVKVFIPVYRCKMKMSPFTQNSLELKWVKGLRGGDYQYKSMYPVDQAPEFPGKRQRGFVIS